MSITCPYCGYEQSIGSYDRVVCESCKRVIERKEEEEE